jgi:hypothetical protein
MQLLQEQIRINRGAYMVTKNWFLKLVLFSLVIAALIIPTTACLAQAVTYTVNKIWVQITVNTDRSINLMYNVTITYTGGNPQGIITVGMPKAGFQITTVQDLSGNTLAYQDASSGNFFGISVTLKSRPTLNQPNTFLVYATVPEMLSPDQTNQGNYGMQFYPTTFSGAQGTISNTRIAIILPSGVSGDEAKYLTGTPFNNTSTEDSSLVVYWERNNWPPAQEFSVGVSFPEQYISLPGPDILTYVSMGAVALTAIGVVMLIVSNFRKFDYVKPHIAVEALGAARNLTSVEAAVVLDLKPVRVLSMILFGLLYKRVVMVTETDPLIKLQKLERSGDEAPPHLWYYEIDYLEALQPDGSLDEMKLAHTYLGLRDTVDQKMRGYSRVDTVNYYQSVVNKAWDQVTQAGTPELKGDALDQNIEWLLADDKFDERFRGAFPSGIIIIPNPGWWWYWYGPRFPSGQAVLAAGAPVSAKIPTQPTPIPGQDFANNIVKGLQTSANNMVKDVQTFANRLAPAPAPTPMSQRSVRSGPGCVCACAHCACACACVSCACACAGGGAR